MFFSLQTTFSRQKKALYNIHLRRRFIKFVSCYVVLSIVLLLFVQKFSLRSLIVVSL